MSEESGKIACKICGQLTHVMRVHLREVHPEVTEADYQAQFPGAPMLSATAEKMLEERRRVASPVEQEQTGMSDEMSITKGRGNLHEVFNLGSAPAAFRKSDGQPLPVETFKVGKGLAHLVPDVDPNYVFDIDLLKVCMMGLSLGENIYLWGHAGTGKSTVFEQIHAYTGRPILRVQHTRNTEERDILGEKTVEDGNVRFVLGPLPFCMKYGLTYQADEYDFGMPSVLAVYQPVLEGKPLVIKEADEANRIIRPHPNFRFVATGNTNGQGDETGLYQGTLLQNAANYERFGIVREVHYMDKSIEAQIIAGQARIAKEVAVTLVDFANRCREAFANGKLGLPPSPRAMIKAAKLAVRLGDPVQALHLAYLNRLSRTDQQAAAEFLKRIEV